MATRRHTTSTLLSMGGALLALVAVTGCSDAAEDTEPEKKSFALSGDALKVVAKNGDLDIRPADVDKVRVTRWFAGYTVMGGSPEVTWSLKDGTLDLKTDCGPALVADCDVRYEVLVPKDTAVTVDSDNGKVKASGFGSELDIDSDNGAIEVKDVSGKLTLRSDNGKVEATGLRSRHVWSESDNGRVELTFTEVPDTVKADSDNGKITVVVPDADYHVSAKASNGDVHNDLPNDPRSKHSITVGSDNGEINLRLAE